MCIRDSLGHELRHDGIRPAESHVQAVEGWKLPTTKTQARAFLGVTGYYRDHIRDYAQMAKPWTDVIGKTTKEEERKPLQVTPAMETAFESLKKSLTTYPVLGFPYFKGDKAGRFTPDTDFCNDQIAGILSQDQGGREVVIAYGSKKLSKSQLRWPSTKGSCTAACTGW